MRKTPYMFLFACLFAVGSLPASAAEPSESALRQIYVIRPDLQQLFDETTLTAAKSPRTAGIMDLHDWARQYGYKEYPNLLAAYSPAALSMVPARKVTSIAPTLVTAAKFDSSKLTSSAVLVVDDASGEALLEINADKRHPIASITKLMTAMLVLDNKVPLAEKMSIGKVDRVGGAQLRIAVGTPLVTRDVFYAMLVGSANDAAHALSRQCESDEAKFVAAMNAKAATLGLSETEFADPTGLELGNVSTPRDVVKLAQAAFSYYDIRKTASTASHDIVVTRKDVRRLVNTNRLLTDNHNGLIVLGGKTGYLDESRWNLVVRMHDGKHPAVNVVVFGAADKTRLFAEAEKAARWVWANYEWEKS